ncbi:ABC transporter permease [Yanghanlia caeni]|uniref:ABC transporter permease n=1 Tax=Yanghanlia caeni TaxID=3064283 RepID=A0ABU1D9W1_9BURK|nr:ABC transporter permease [Alcaligenaceae bacterium LG-2]
MSHSINSSQPNVQFFEETTPTKKSSSPARWQIYLWRIAVIIVLALLWEWGANTGFLDHRFVGRPSGIGHALYEIMTGPTIWTHASSTIIATILAFFIGSILGIACGLVLAAWPLLDDILDPIIVGLNSIPRVALAPLFILWFGIGIESKAFAGFSLVFFILLITTRSGLKNADPDLLLMARTLCASKLQTFLTVVVPISVPAIFSGLELAAVYSLLGVVVAEMIASQAGLGVVVSQYAQTFAINETFAVLIILGVLSALLATAVQLVEAWVLKWKDE